jgi:hypothetical protein
MILRTYLAAFIACCLTHAAAADEPPAGKSPEKNLLERLLKGEKESQAPPAAAPSRLVEKMQEVSRRIGNQQAGDAVQKQQKEIIAELDRLIEASRKASRQQQQASQSKASDQRGDDRDEGTPDASTGDGGKRTSAGKSGDSSPRVDKADAEGARLRPGEDLVKNVWGHLPPAVRQRMLNAYNDKTLPKYADLVRRYYEALAESDRKK